MKFSLTISISVLFILSSCSDKTYTENLNQSEWIELYENISLSDDSDAVKKKFPAISNWVTEQKDNKEYFWTAQRIFESDAYVAFIFQEQTLYQVKIYLKGLSEGDAEKVFNSLKSKYTNSISGNKQFCNNENSSEESCFWLLESMTVYLKKVQYDEPLILFGFQKR